MTNKLSLSSSISSATLVAINSISAATVAADDKQNHHAATVVAAVATDDPLKVVSVEQDDITSALDITEREDRLFTPKSSTAAMKPDIGILSKDFFKNKGREKPIANSAPSSIAKKRSTVEGAPDIGILSKDFLKNKGREQPVDKQFTIHRKKRASAADVDVGILSNERRQQKPVDVLGRSLQSVDELSFMCPGKNGYPGVYSFGNLFNETDGYFPKCSCPSPTTCGPNLCECLELDADGDIFQCMDPFKQLCEGTMYIEGIPGPWSMKECLGSTWHGKSRALAYCSMLPCFVDGGSVRQCACNFYDSQCTDFRHPIYCAKSKCCQAQTDDEGREACMYGGDLYKNYYDQVEEALSFTIGKEMITRFNECSFNSDGDKSIVQCYCESFSYGLCVNVGAKYPDLCEAMNCCYEQTEDDARLDCFTTRFRDTWTGFYLYYFSNYSDELQESCVASGRSSDQCKCDIQGLSSCVGVGSANPAGAREREPNCDLFQCCQSQTEDNDEGRKDCLLPHEAQSSYETCVNDGNTTESCYCDKSNTLCSSGHSNGRHCELSSCCQNQADDTGRKECIGNFTTSQPSSAPSETTPAEDTGDDEASPTDASDLPGTSSSSIRTPFGKSLAKITSKMLAVAAVIGWLLLS